MFFVDLWSATVSANTLLYSNDIRLHPKQNVRVGFILSLPAASLKCAGTACCKHV